MDLAVLNEFEGLLATLKGSSNQVKKVDEDIYYINPDQLKGTKKLAFMALTHGDEIAGIHILNHFLKRMISKKISLENELYLVIANREAYKIDERYVDRDLNRLFGIAPGVASCHEEKRVHAIKDVLDLCDVSIDLHQTIDPTRHPFFIFPYQKPTYQFAQMIAPELAVIGSPLPDQATTSSSYMALKNKIGITLEVGSNGIDLYQKTLGGHLLEEVLREINQPLRELPSSDKLYRFTYFEPYKEGELYFKAGLRNFDYLNIGDAVAQLNGKDLLTPEAGYLIRYPQKWFQNDHYQPDGVYYLVNKSDNFCDFTPVKLS